MQKLAISGQQYFDLQNPLLFGLDYADLISE